MLRTFLLIAALTLFAFFVRTARSAEAPTKRPHVQKIDVEKFDQMRKEKDTVVLDVRTPDEFKKGHVPGAVNINVDDPTFNKRVEKLDKSKTYLVHCASGVRSAKLAKMGFDHLFDFSAGFRGYKKAGKPVEK